MREYVITNLLKVQRAPGVQAPPLGAVSRRGENVSRLLEYRWLCALKWLESEIRSGAIQIANETARTLRMDAEHFDYVANRLLIPLEEYTGERRLDVLPELPAPKPPDDEPRKPRRSFWHLGAVGLAVRGKRLPGIGRGHGINVAVIDSGVDASHPELAGKVLQTLTVDSKGRVEPTTQPSDALGHGTFVSSLVVGKTMGVAPGARLISLQVLDEHGVGTDSSILSALDWVADASDRQGRPLTRIVVLCLGRGGETDPIYIYQTAMLSLMDRGILPIVAVGNEGPDRPTSPGDCYAVLSVGAMTKRRRVADFSGSGQREFSELKYAVPSLVAPGEDVFSGIPGASAYAAWTGATPATAIVAGIAALLAEKRSDLDAWQLRDQLLSQCRLLPGEPGERQGAGLIQAGSENVR